MSTVERFCYTTKSNFKAVEEVAHLNVKKPRNEKAGSGRNKRKI